MLQFLKCLYWQDLLFQEEPSLASEPGIEAETQEYIDSVESGSWDRNLEELDNSSNGFQGHNEDDNVFVHGTV